MLYHAKELLGGAFALDYKTLYFHLFTRVSTVVEELQQLQQETEDLYMQMEETEEDLDMQNEKEPGL